MTSSRCRVTAHLNTVVALVYTSCKIDSGKWNHLPGGVVNVGSNDIFQALDHDGATEWIGGRASYQAADGTQFTFDFKDNLSHQNRCTSSMTNVHGPWYLPQPDFPKGGKSWNVTYHISQREAFFDAPVFPEHVVEAAKCAEYPEERVRDLIAGRSVLYLKDALEAQMPLRAKLWCAVHQLFLNPPSKALLTRDLVQFAVKGHANTSLVPEALLDDALDNHEGFRKGEIGSLKLAGLRERIDGLIGEESGSDNRDVEILSMLSALTERQGEVGWEHAVHSYIGDVETELDEERIGDVLNVIEARL